MFHIFNPYKPFLRTIENACIEKDMQLILTPRGYSYYNDNYRISFVGERKDVELLKKILIDGEVQWRFIMAYEDPNQFVRNGRAMGTFNDEAKEILTFLGFEPGEKKTYRLKALKPTCIA